jgi:hypothetical protein
MNEKKTWFKLSKQKINTLCIYFFILIFLSVALLLSIIIEELHMLCGLSIMTKSILGAIATSAMGSSIFYFRKIYKSCINLDMVNPQSDEDRIRETGVFLYFILRPIFSICFAIILILFFQSGMSFLAEIKSINERFIFVAMVTSFFIGYSSGDLIDKLEEKGRQLIDKATG